MRHELLVSLRSNNKVLCPPARAQGLLVSNSAYNAMQQSLKFLPAGNSGKRTLPILLSKGPSTVPGKARPASPYLSQGLQHGITVQIVTLICFGCTDFKRPRSISQPMDANGIMPFTEKTQDLLFLRPWAQTRIESVLSCRSIQPKHDLNLALLLLASQ